MRARRRSAQTFVSGRRSRDQYRLADFGGERLWGVLGEDDPVYGPNIVIVVRSIERQMVSEYQPRMSVRHSRRVPVFRITAMHVSKRRLREGKKQREGGRDCRRTFQDCLQFMRPKAGWSTRRLGRQARIRSPLSHSAILQHLPCRVVAGRAHHAAAWMRAGPA